MLMGMTRFMKILIIGDDERSFLSVLRSLGRKGHVVDVIMHRRNSISSACKYIRHHHTLPHVALSPKKWLETVYALQVENKYDLIIPCDDTGLVPFMVEVHKLNMARVATPGEKAFPIFFDKCHTRELCLELKIAVAKTIPLTQKAFADIPYPVVLKPKSSVTVEGLAKKRTVSILHSPDEVSTILNDLEDRDAYFLECFFEGIGVGVSVLADKGTVTHAFQHERIEEGVAGGSSLRKSVPLHKGMLDDVMKLAAATNLQGVAMFEFRCNKQTGHFILLEVNARFWGSLPLAVYAGMDFPALLAKQYSQQECISFPAYSVGKISRALTPSFYYLARAFGTARSFKERLFILGSQCAALLRIITLKEKIDTFSFDDPHPFFQELSSILGVLLKGISKRIGLAKFNRKFVKRKQVKWLKKNREHLENILILCYGNICRSPFAEAVLSEDLNGSHHVIISAGFHMVEDRRSPDDAVNAAKRVHIDLTKHKSQFAHKDMIEAASVILIFDEKNQLDMASMYPDAGYKVINLGNLLQVPQDIKDPYGQCSEVFDLCYQQIHDAMADFAKILNA